MRRNCSSSPGWLPASGSDVIGSEDPEGGDGRGFALTAANEPLEQRKLGCQWGDPIDFRAFPVIIDEQLAKVLAD